MNKESYFINQFASSEYIGDDGAVVGNLVYSMDAFFENVHFKTEWMSLKQIAKKAMLVNISDAIVMNAQPKYALLSVAIPKEYTQQELEELAEGFKEVADLYGVEIIGGDTISNIKLDISITIISELQHNTKAIKRTGTELGDCICYTGSLGSTKADLETLLAGGSIAKDSKFLEPKLHADFFYAVAEFINSAMDISDGLFFELERLSKANNIGFEFVEQIANDVGCSGEEYEILFSFHPKHKEKVFTLAEKHGVELHLFAHAKSGTFSCPCQEHHFKE
jgi:thiamine-monophosphate kinase